MAKPAEHVMLCRFFFVVIDPAGLAGRHSLARKGENGGGCGCDHPWE
jgi:hypothetical protein